MKKFLHLAALLLLSVTFVLVSPATTLAKGKPKKSTPAPIDTNDKITAVHLTSITVNVFANQKAQEYKVTPATKITINGIEGKLSGLTTGMDVTITPMPNDPTSAQSVEAKSPKR